eukprot:g27614.t1
MGDVTEIVYCPVRRVGALIGKAGATIIGLRKDGETQRASVEVDKTETKEPRQVTISGAPSQVKVALQRINDIINNDDRRRPRRDISRSRSRSPDPPAFVPPLPVATPGAPPPPPHSHPPPPQSQDSPPPGQPPPHYPPPASYPPSYPEQPTAPTPSYPSAQYPPADAAQQYPPSHNPYAPPGQPPTQPPPGYPPDPRTAPDGRPAAYYPQEYAGAPPSVAAYPGPPTSEPDRSRRGRSSAPCARERRRKDAPDVTPTESGEANSSKSKSGKGQKTKGPPYPRLPAEDRNASAVPVWTVHRLAEHSGSDRTRPLLLAILGEVYDVGPGERHYGPDAGYSGMAGKDASRSFTTGDFKKDAVPGLRDLPPEQLADVISCGLRRVTRRCTVVSRRETCGDEVPSPATYVMICGVTQLICPMAGLFSDRLNCSFGRRRPFLQHRKDQKSHWLRYAPGFLCLYFCSRYLCPEGFLCALAFTETSLNVAFAAHAALPADLRVQPQFEEPSTRGAESEAGLISGIMALHSFLGAVCAVGFLDFTSGAPLYFFYLVYGIAVLVVCTFVSLVAKEDSSSNLSSPSAGEILAAYSMDTERDADFFWVCYGRLLFYTSQSVIVFMAYFIRDMFQVRSEPEVISKLSLLVFIGQGVGAVVAVPSSRISDLVGCKPMSFGLWGIAGFIGSCLGPLVTGGVLWLFTGDDETSVLHGPHYEYQGYVLGMILAGSMPALAVIPATRLIQRTV